MGTLVIADERLDYLGLDDTTRAFVADRTEEIRHRIAQTNRNIAEIGRYLQEVKAALPYGCFCAWLRVEFTWSESLANKMMNVVDRFPGLLSSVKFMDNVGQSALYLLAAPSTPEAAVREALDTARDGPLTYTAAREIVQRHKAPSLEETRGRNEDGIFAGLEDITAAALSIRRALEMAAHAIDDPDAARLLLDAHQDAELIRTTAIQVRTLAGGAPYQPRR